MTYNRKRGCSLAFDAVVSIYSFLLYVFADPLLAGLVILRHAITTLSCSAQQCLQGCVCTLSFVRTCQLKPAISYISTLVLPQAADTEVMASICSETKEKLCISSCLPAIVNLHPHMANASLLDPPLLHVNPASSFPVMSAGSKH